MGSCVNVLVYWGGHIVNTDQGVGYDIPHQRVISVDRNITHQDLLNNLNKRAYVMKEGCIAKMTCRFPTSVPPNPLIYSPLEIEDDETVRIMMNVMDLGKFSCIELYLDFVAPTSMQLGLDAILPSLVSFSSMPSQFDAVANNTCHGVDGVGCSSVTCEGPVLEHIENLTQSQPVALVNQTGFEDVRMDDCLPCGRDAPMDLVDVENDGGENFESFEYEENEGGIGDGGTVGPEMACERDHEPMSGSFTEFDISRVEDVCAKNPSKYRSGSLWDPSTQEPMTSLVFPTRGHLTDAVAIYSIHQNRVLSVQKSNAESWVAVCKVATEKGCKWHLRAKMKANLGLWMITRYSGPHTCLYASVGADHPHLSSTLAAKVILNSVKNNPEYKITDIVETVKARFQITISYRKACIAKNKAIEMAFGNWDESYKQLPKFMAAMKHYNPGTIVNYGTSRTVVDGTDLLVFVFWAMSGCIMGFQYCRPLITIDATFLKGKYKGVIMVANGVDANGQIFPLAFAIADSESKENWGLFLKRLREHVAKDRKDICLISDRGGGILAAVKNRQNGWTTEEYGVHHVFCLRHIQGNLMDACAEHKQAIAELMMVAATEHQVRKFEEAMALIKAIDEKAEKWLRKIPLDKWTLSHDGGRRFGILTSNLAESFNNVLLGARALPITALVESIYFRINKYFADRYSSAKRLCEVGMGVTPQVHKRIDKWKNKSGTHTVKGHNYESGIFTVHTRYHGTSGGNIQTVRLSDRYCSCGKWHIYGHPCSHAIAVCQSRALDWMDYVPQWFHVSTWAKCYEHTIMPIEHRAYWPPPPHNKTFVPNPLLLRTKGRARDKRIRSDMDLKNKRESKCSNCQTEGHDRRTCPSGSRSRGRAPIL